MTDRRLTILFVGLTLLALVGAAAWNGTHGHPVADFLDKAMIVVAALLPSPLSKTATGEAQDVQVVNKPADPVPVDPAA